MPTKPGGAPDRVPSPLGSPLEASLVQPAAGALQYRPINRMIWEALIRQVRRAKEADSFYASWASFLAGVTAASLIAFLTIWLTATTNKPNSIGQAIFAVLGVSFGVFTYVIWRIEKRARANRTSPLDALREDMEAVETYFLPSNVAGTPQAVNTSEPISAKGS